MTYKITFETDDVRDVVAFNESRVLWRLVWRMLNDLPQEIYQIGEAHPVNSVGFDAEFVKLFKKYEKSANVLRYTKEGNYNG